MKAFIIGNIIGAADYLFSWTEDMKNFYMKVSFWVFFAVFYVVTAFLVYGSSYHKYYAEHVKEYPNINESYHINFASHQAVSDGVLWPFHVIGWIILLPFSILANFSIWLMG